MMQPVWLGSRTGVPDLFSDRIVFLSGKALVDPGSLDPQEIQELAAAVVAYLSSQSEARERGGSGRRPQ